MFPAKKNRQRHFGPLSQLLLGLVLSTAATAMASPSPLPPAVLTALAAAQIPPDAFAVVVEKLDPPQKGYRLLAENAAQAMNPASVMKLFTTSAALDLLGPARTWKTELRALQLPRGGVLRGPLYLKGSGDPKLGMEHLWQLLRELRLRGVRDIRGDLLIDRSLFELPPHDTAAFDGEALRPYNAGADAALINFNALRFLLVPDHKTARVDALLETPDATLRVSNRLQAVAGECGDWREGIDARVDGNQLALSGRFARTCGDKRLNLSPRKADAQIEGLFRALWQELGGTFTGKVGPGAAPENSLVIATHESPSLSEAVRDTNKFSNNVMARQIFLALSADAPPASYEKSGARLRGWLAGRNIAAPELVIENGAGLSRQDRASADTLSALLRSVWISPSMPEFVASLPIFGEDGTLRKRGHGNADGKGRAHLKTGYLAGVRALAGYVLDSRGERWLLVAMINHANALRGKDAMDQLVSWIVARPAGTSPRPD